MANYYCFIRTNYFHVTDEQRFREILANCASDDEIEVFEDDEKTGRFGFGLYGGIYGLKESENDEDSELDEDISLFYTALQGLLVDGEAILITEVGYEKLRYLVACTVIITKDSIETVNLRDHAFKKAGEMLNVERYCTKDQY